MFVTVLDYFSFYSCISFLGSFTFFFYESLSSLITHQMDEKSSSSFIGTLCFILFNEFKNICSEERKKNLQHLRKVVELGDSTVFWANYLNKNGIDFCFSFDIEHILLCVCVCVVLFFCHWLSEWRWLNLWWKCYKLVFPEIHSGSVSVIQFIQTQQTQTSVFWFSYRPFFVEELTQNLFYEKSKPTMEIKTKSVKIVLIDSKNEAHRLQ